MKRPVGNPGCRAAARGPVPRNSVQGSTVNRTTEPADAGRSAADGARRQSRRQENAPDRRRPLRRGGGRGGVAFGRLHAGARALARKDRTPGHVAGGRIREAGRYLPARVGRGLVNCAPVPYRRDAVSDPLPRYPGPEEAVSARRGAKTPHAFSRDLYRLRNRVERFFNRLKQFRRIATRYEELAANYLAMIKIPTIRIWLRANESTP